MTKVKYDLTADIVRELLSYDPKTGVLVWRHRASHWFIAQNYADGWNTRFAGVPAGSNNFRGCSQIDILGRKRLTHRVIWLWMTGEYPPGEIDHIDHDPSNNRWVNLRTVSSTENKRNRTQPHNNSSGVTGVSWHAKSGNWRAKVGNSYSAYFKSFDEAVAACRAEQAARGFHPNHGTPK